MTDIKHAVFRKHMSLLAAGIRSDYFDERPPFKKTFLAAVINSLWGK